MLSIKKEGDDSIMLVYGRAENPKRVTLDQFIDQIAGTYDENGKELTKGVLPKGTINGETIKNALPGSVGEIALSLSHVYFVKKTDKDENDKSEKEYAFCVNLHLDNLTK